MDSNHEAIWPTNVKVLLLDRLLGLACEANEVFKYISDFNSILGRLKSHEVVFGDDVAVAILLRGLPREYQFFVQHIRNREKDPTLQETTELLHGEFQLMKATQIHEKQSDSAFFHHNTGSKPQQERVKPTCEFCKKKGHTSWPEKYAGKRTLKWLQYAPIAKCEGIEKMPVTRS